MAILDLRRKGSGATLSILFLKLLSSIKKETFWSVYNRVSTHFEDKDEKTSFEIAKEDEVVFAESVSERGDKAIIVKIKNNQVLEKILLKTLMLLKK